MKHWDLKTLKLFFTNLRRQNVLIIWLLMTATILWASVYREAAQERTARDAATVAAAMARAGAEAIADFAEALPPRIADRYLALKAAGRL